MHVIVTTDCSKRVMMGNGPRGTEKLHSLFGCQDLNFVVWCLSDQIFVYHIKCAFFRSDPNTPTLHPHDGSQNILGFNESTALIIAELPTRQHDSGVRDSFRDADNVVCCAYMLCNVQTCFVPVVWKLNITVFYLISFHASMLFSHSHMCFLSSVMGGGVPHICPRVINPCELLSMVTFNCPTSK